MILNISQHRTFMTDIKLPCIHEETFMYPTMGDDMFDRHPYFVLMKRESYIQKWKIICLSNNKFYMSVGYAMSCKITSMTNLNGCNACYIYY